MKKPLLFLPTGMIVSLLLAPPAWSDAGKGEAYFTSIHGGNCSSCHYVDHRKLVGPGLENVTQRHSDEWLKEFLTDPQATWKTDNAETLELKKRVRKTRAPKTLCIKAHMSSDQVQDLLDYLKVLEK